MRTKIKDLRGATSGTSTLSRIVDMVQDLGSTLQPPPAAEVRGEPGSRTHPLTVELTPARASVVDTLQTFAGPILHPLATTGLILIFTIFILLQREDLRNRAIKLAGGSATCAAPRRRSTTLRAGSAGSSWPSSPSTSPSASSSASASG